MLLFIFKIFKLIKILKWGSAVAGVLAVVSFFGFRRQRHLRLTSVLGLMIIALLLFTSFQILKKDKKLPLTSTSIFKKMEYIEHLKLVSFYSEEVVVLGTKEKVLRIVERLERDTQEINNQLALDNARIIRQEEALDSLFNAIGENTDQLTAKKSAMKISRENYKSFRDCKLKKGKCPLATGDDPSLQLLYHVYLSADSAHKASKAVFDAAPWKQIRERPRRKKRAQMRQELKSKMDSLFQDLTEKHQLLANKLKRDLETEEKKWDDQMKLSNRQQKRRRQWVKDLKKQRDDSWKKWEKTLAKKQKLENKLEEARLELAFAQEAGNEIDPEVLIILPSEVAVYIDMKEVTMEPRGAGDSLLVITLPEIRFDSVFIELPTDSAVYKLDSKGTEWVTSQQGAYYDLFGQLKEAVLQKEKEVLAKAIENNIVEEGRQMAETYLQNFVAPLGYEIVFREPETVPLLLQP